MNRNKFLKNTIALIGSASIGKLIAARELVKEKALPDVVAGQSNCPGKEENVCNDTGGKIKSILIRNNSTGQFVYMSPEQFKDWIEKTGK